jgi:hypothetical protein
VVRYLIALSSTVLIHHHKNTVNLITIANVEGQMIWCIPGIVIVVGDSCCCVGKDERTKGVSSRTRSRALML